LVVNAAAAMVLGWLAVFVGTVIHSRDWLDGLPQGPTYAALAEAGSMLSLFTVLPAVLVLAVVLGVLGHQAATSRDLAWMMILEAVIDAVTAAILAAVPILAVAGLSALGLRAGGMPLSYLGLAPAFPAAAFGIGAVPGPLKGPGDGATQRFGAGFVGAAG
jgi:hypothetical protein